MIKDTFIKVYDKSNYLHLKIDEFADVIMGQSPPSETYNSDKIGLPFFQGKAEFGKMHPVVQKWCTASNKIAYPDDILISVRAPVGSVNLANISCGIGRGLAAIRYPKCPRFLFYYFQFVEKKLDEKGTGTTFRAISADVLRNNYIYLPPLAEQQRIVAKIEELLSDLDKGIETLKTAKEQLKVYRQAVLQYTFKPYGLNASIGELFDFVGGGTPSKDNSDYWDGDLPWASVKDVKGDYLTNTQDRITEAGLLNSATNLAQVDDVILITRINPGRTIISKIQTAVNQDLKIIKPKSKASTLYIHYLFQNLQRECQNKSSGTTVLGLTIQNLKEIKVPNVPFEEQVSIVKEIESRLSVCNKIEESIEQGLEQSEALRQSILKRAFEGKLVPQDPNDEHASVLLEKIKAEKALAGSNKSIKKKKVKA